MAQTHQQLFIAFLIAIPDLHSADLAPYHTSSFSFPWGSVGRGSVKRGTISLIRISICTNKKHCFFLKGREQNHVFTLPSPTKGKFLWKQFSSGLGGRCNSPPMGVGVVSEYLLFVGGVWRSGVCISSGCRLHKKQRRKQRTAHSELERDPILQGLPKVKTSSDFSNSL